MNNPAPAHNKTAVLLLRSTSRNFPLDLAPELQKAGHAVHAAENLDEFIASPVRSKPFLAVLELGNAADLDRAVIVFDWTEQMQPMAPGRYLLLLSSKNIQLGDRVHRFGSAEIAVLPQPARNLLFKLELQSRLLASQGASEKNKKSVKGFSATVEQAPDGRHRILIARGQDEKAGAWRTIDGSPQGKVRWRWIRNPEREAPGDKDDYSWLADSVNAPAFDKKLDAWVIEGEEANLVCLKGETKLYDANAAAGNAEKKKADTSKNPETHGEEKPAEQKNEEAPPQSGTSTSPQNSSPEKQETKAPTQSPERSEEASNEEKRAEADSPRAEKKKQSPFAPVESAEKEAEPQAAPSSQNPAVSALARLKRQLDQKNAGEAPEKPGHGELLYNAPAGAGSPRPDLRMQAGGAEDSRAPFRVVPSRDQEEKKGAERPAQNIPGPPGAPLGPDPEDFSRSAGVGSLPGNTAVAGTPAREGEPSATRSAGGGVPFHAVPSRDAAHTPPGTGSRASAPAYPEGHAELREDPVESQKEPAAPVAGLAAAAGEATPSAGAAPPAPAASATPTKLPETSLPGGAFDSHLPALGQGQGGAPGALSPAAKAATPAPRPAAEEIQAPAPSGQAPAPSATLSGEPAPLGSAQSFRQEKAAPEENRTVKGGPAPLQNLEVRPAAPAEKNEDESRRFLRDRLFLLMTLQELSDKESSWHPVGKYRIYLGARHRYYGLPHPGDVLPLWIYEGELAPEFIDEQKSWKFYDRRPVAIFSLETLPQEVLEYLYKLARKELPKVAAAGGPGLHIGAGSEELPAAGGELPDHYEPEAEKKNRGAFGKVLDFIKGLFGN